MTNPNTFTANATEVGKHAVDTTLIDSNSKYLKYEIDDLYGRINDLMELSGSNGYPIGSILAYSKSSWSGGDFLPCDGAAVSRTTYANLFAVIRTTFGVGNGTTTFNVPNLSSYFIQGWDHSRTFGSAQAASNKAHTHSYVDRQPFKESATQRYTPGTSYVAPYYVNLYFNGSKYIPPVYTENVNSSGSSGVPKNVTIRHYIRF